MSKVNIEELENKIISCSNISIDDVKKEEINDLSEVKISKKKKGYDKILEFIKNVSNPYIFNIDNKIVKIEFTDNGQRAEDRIINIINTMYK